MKKNFNRNMNITEKSNKNDSYIMSNAKKLEIYNNNFGNSKTKNSNNSNNSGSQNNGCPSMPICRPYRRM